jgi:hypothetical protein
MEPFFTLFTAILLLAFLLYAGAFTKKRSFELTGDDDLDGRLTYQLLLMVASAVSLCVAYFLAPDQLHRYFSIGSIDAPAEPLLLFGIAEGERWGGAGLSIGLMISVVTAAVMFLNLRRAGIRPFMPSGFGWVLLLSLSNAFGEEMVCRVGLIAPLDGHLSPVIIFFISAVIFGVAHYRGVPSGISGVFLAGILGFVLAKSVYETGGFFWAWSIHFVQDVIIIGAMFMMRSVPDEARLKRAL